MKFTNFFKNINFQNSVSGGSNLFSLKNKIISALAFGISGYYLIDKFKFNTSHLNENEKLVYSWGNGIAGQLGVGEEIGSQPIPKIISELSNINHGNSVEKLVAAFDLSCGITNKGEIYVWGKTKDGALGVIPGGSVNTPTPSLFVHSDQIDSKMRDIDFSKEHGALVTENGSLYTWGLDMYNKLGHPQIDSTTINQKQRKAPKTVYELIKFNQVPITSKIISARCGYNHTICLDEEGSVYSWGYGKDGALGHENFENISSPKKIDFFVKNNIKIKSIECGDYFTLALAEDGSVYTWGHNNYGQLGLGKISQQLKVNKPTRVNLGNKKVKQLFAGEDHSACITEDGEGYIWGYGLDGRLGNKNKMNQNVPTKISIIDEKIKKISCGGHHTAILTESGDLFMCGNGRDGELGRGDLLESQSVMRDVPLLVKKYI
jgi:alpha-tubulin suppressor-like RCC1 family protein